MNQCDCGNEAEPSWCEDTCARRHAPATELTPERIREAAEVLSALAAESNPNAAAHWCTTPYTSLDLHSAARSMDQAKAAEALREKRVDELAREIRGMVDGYGWNSIARGLLARYPALAEQIQEKS